MTFFISEAEKNLKDKVWDVRLSIHANKSPEQLMHEGRLNAPNVKEISVLLLSDDVIAKKHSRCDCVLHDFVD